MKQDMTKEEIEIVSKAASMEAGEPLDLEEWQIRLTSQTVEDYIVNCKSWSRCEDHDHGEIDGREYAVFDNAAIDDEDAMSNFILIIDLGEHRAVYNH
jgi:hypothetical protein